MKNATTTKSSYHTLLRTIHWSMALCITALFISGAIMVEFQSTDSLRPAFYAFHKSIGAMILALFVVRLLARRLTIAPPLPEGIPRWEQKVAHLGHAALYLLMLSAPLSGWATSDVYGYGVKFFDLPLPQIFPTVGPEVGAQVGDIHTYIAYAFLAMVMLHLLAIAKHRYIDRRCIMSRMA